MEYICKYNDFRYLCRRNENGCVKGVKISHDTLLETVCDTFIKPQQKMLDGIHLSLV